MVNPTDLFLRDTRGFINIIRVLRVCKYKMMKKRGSYHVETRVWSDARARRMRRVTVLTDFTRDGGRESATGGDEETRTVKTRRALSSSSLFL